MKDKVRKNKYRAAGYVNCAGCLVPRSMGIYELREALMKRRHRLPNEQQILDMFFRFRFLTKLRMRRNDSA